jgi:hypothetical protein
VVGYGIPGLARVVVPVCLIRGRVVRQVVGHCGGLVGRQGEHIAEAAATVDDCLTVGFWLCAVARSTTMLVPGGTSVTPTEVIYGQVLGKDGLKRPEPPLL